MWGVFWRWVLLLGDCCVWLDLLLVERGDRWRDRGIEAGIKGEVLYIYWGLGTGEDNGLEEVG
jgi:hypothetical protein